MNRIDLSKAQKIITENYTSKGNQPKWLQANKWYKADHMGYEALCEVIISRLLEKSNVESFVKYDPVMIDYNDKEYVGCVSDNFRGKDDEIITLEKLCRAYTGKSMAEAISKQESAEDKISYTVRFIEHITGLGGVGKYISVLLALDAFFLNEDRHTNNIAFIRKNKAFKFSPIFDNGLSLLADTGDYPLENDVYENMKKVKSKPFSLSFDEQLDAAEMLYGCHLKLRFSKADVYDLFEELGSFYEEKIIQRAQRVIFMQMAKYSYFFE